MERYPLTWPEGWKRAKEKRNGRFRKDGRMTLRFVEETHQYFKTLQGVEREVYSVTTIMKAVGLSKFFHYEVAMALGTKVHLIIKQYEESGCSPDFIVEKVFYGYLKAYQSFKAFYEYHPEIVEEPLYSELGYCGTPDSFGNSLRGYLLPDFKTGSMSWVTGIQLAGYERLIRDNKLVPAGARIQRVGIYLGADGSWKPTPFIDRSDWATFICALSIVNCVMNHGGTIS